MTFLSRNLHPTLSPIFVSRIWMEQYFRWQHCSVAFLWVTPPGVAFFPRSPNIRFIIHFYGFLWKAFSEAVAGTEFVCYAILLCALQPWNDWVVPVKKRIKLNEITCSIETIMCRNPESTHKHPYAINSLDMHRPTYTMRTTDMISTLLTFISWLQRFVTGAHNSNDGQILISVRLLVTWWNYKRSWLLGSFQHLLIWENIKI